MARLTGFVEIRSQTSGRLLFEFDPARQLVRIKPKGQPAAELVDLTAWQDQAPPQPDRPADNGRQ